MKRNKNVKCYKIIQKCFSYVSVENNFAEIRDHNFSLLSSGFNSKQGGLEIDIQESFNNKVLSLINEALSSLVQLSSSCITLLFEHFDILSCSNLSFLLDSFPVL